MIKVLDKKSKFKRISYSKKIKKFKIVNKKYSTKKYNSHFVIVFIYFAAKNFATAPIFVS